MSNLKNLLLSLIVLCLLNGCTTWRKLNNMEKGGVIGAGTGALIGASVGGAVGVVVGGAAGAFGGAVIGNEAR